MRARTTNPAVDNSLFDYEAALARCALGDRQALHALYRQESPRLLGVALRLLRDRQLAEDVVHDAFLKIWASAGSFAPHLGSGRGWMYTIVRHLALNLLRNRSSEVNEDEGASSAQAVAASLESADVAALFAAKADHGRLQHCLTQLDDPKRQCILHAYLDGLTHADIAQRLDAPLGTVKAWIKRGMAALRECMA